LVLRIVVDLACALVIMFCQLGRTISDFLPF
jgi:hypothetical protein